MSDHLPDARWGEADTPLPDWRDVLGDDDDADDDAPIATPPDVIEMLGFDPAEDDEDAEPDDTDIGSAEDTDLPDGLLSALIDALAADCTAFDEFNESDHPRDGGKFTAGSGGSAPSKEAVERKLDHLEALAKHPNTPPNEAEAARGRIKELRQKYDLKPSFAAYKPLFEDPKAKTEAAPAWTATPNGTYRNRAGYEHDKSGQPFPHPDYAGPSPAMGAAHAAMTNAFRAMSANRTPETEAAFKAAHHAHAAEQDRDDKRRVSGDAIAEDAAEFAFDRSLRSYDSNGHLHVASCPISKANICGYYGHEIPDAEKLGLDPNRLYQLYRDPDELAKAVETFNGLPVLLKHQPVSADSHPKHLTVGTTGSEASFNHPYLHNALTIWDRDAIDGIESEDRKQLSSAYRYRADMTPGTIDGRRFDGVMRDIRGNHVALVPEGRAGDDVVVGDAKPKESNTMPTTKKVASVSRKALFLHGALAAYVTPKLGQDQKPPDLRAMLKGVTAKNWPARRKTFTAGLTKALEGRLAQDATLEDVVGFIDALESANGGPEQADLDDDPLPLEGDPTDPAAAAPGEVDEGKDAEEFEGKETPEEEILEYLSTVLSPEQLAHVREIATKAGQGGGEKPPAEKPPEAADPPANPEPDPTKDEDPDDKDANMNTKPPAPVDRAAMDQAITAAVKAERVRAAALREAEKVVRPWIGDIAIAQDSAEAVYRLALDSLGLKDKIEGVHPSAWRTILELQPKPSERRPAAPTRVAMDAATAKDFAERYPHANRLKQI